MVRKDNRLSPIVYKLVPGELWGILRNKGFFIITRDLRFIDQEGQRHDREWYCRGRPLSRLSEHEDIIATHFAE
jgi:hypothetical protein